MVIEGSERMQKLLLASGSPRRKELLSQAGIPFETRVPDFDEKSVNEPDPRKLAQLLARRKGETVSSDEHQVVLSADTVVSCEGFILTKPASQEEALQMLQLLNGKVHEVYTGVMIGSRTKQNSFAVRTLVEFWSLSEQELRDYISAGESLDKAGGYGIQSRGAVLVKQINGDFYNVVGLPVSQVVRHLREFGIFPVFQ